MSFHASHKDLLMLITCTGKPSHLEIIEIINWELKRKKKKTENANKQSSAVSSRPNEALENKNELYILLV